MPRLQYDFSGDAFADGSGGDKFLIDLSEGLSNLYGKMVRQGQIFRVRQVDVRCVNPNTLVQDEVMGVSGKLVWFHPTSPRKKAWLGAFRACQKLRGLYGFSSASSPRNYDFRVGLAQGYSTDVGIFGEGVKFNAWCNSDSDELHLTHGNEWQSIFGVWNKSLMNISSPYNYTEGFGTPFATAADALGDEMDFISQEYVYFKKDQASLEAASAPFQVAFSQVFDSAGHIVSYDIGGTTTPSHIDGPLDVMCGLLGVYVDTTTVDDSETQTQDWRIEVSVDVESWSPIVKRRKSKKSRRKSKR